MCTYLLPGESDNLLWGKSSTSSLSKPEEPHVFKVKSDSFFLLFFHSVNLHRPALLWNTVLLYLLSNTMQWQGPGMLLKLWFHYRKTHLYTYFKRNWKSCLGHATHCKYDYMFLKMTQGETNFSSFKDQLSKTVIITFWSFKIEKKHFLHSNSIFFLLCNKSSSADIGGKN